MELPSVLLRSGAGPPVLVNLTGFFLILWEMKKKKYFRSSVLALPETPSWLCTKDRAEDARKALQWLRAKGKDVE